MKWLENSFPIGCTVQLNQFMEYVAWVLGGDRNAPPQLGEVRAHFVNMLDEPCITVRWDDGKEEDFNESCLKTGYLLRV